MSMRDNIAKYLKEKKTEKGLSWDEISKGAGIGKTTLLCYAKGKVNPRLDTVEQLCIYFGETPNKLLLGDAPDEFLLDHVIPAIGILAELPLEKKVAFAELFVEMLTLWDVDRSPEDTQQKAKKIKKTEK